MYDAATRSTYAELFKLADARLRDKIAAIVGEALKKRAQAPLPGFEVK